jgi:hypothetical protein
MSLTPVRFSSAQEITEMRKRQVVSTDFASGYQPIKNRYNTTLITLFGARANRIPAQQNTCCPITAPGTSDKPTPQLRPLWNPV